MNLIYFHNWYYASPETGKKNAEAAMEAVRQNAASFPYGSRPWEIASAEANAGGDHYWLLLFLVSGGSPSDDSAGIRDRLRDWLEAVGAPASDDRSVMTARFPALQECLDSAYPGAYTLHDVLRGGE